MKTPLDTAREWCERFIEKPAESYHIAPLSALIEQERETALKALIAERRLTEGERTFTGNVHEGHRDGNFGMHQVHVQKLLAIICRLTAPQEASPSPGVQLISGGCNNAGPSEVSAQDARSPNIGHNAPPLMDHPGAAMFAATLLDREAVEQEALVDGDILRAVSYREAAGCLRNYYVGKQSPPTGAEKEDK